MIIPAEFFNKIDLPCIQLLKRGKGNPKGQKTKYADLLLSFDIETSIYKEGVNRESFMYIWQLQYGFACTVIGRTWEEFIDTIEHIKSVLSDSELKVVCYVHNLSYEFQFLRGIWNFQNKDVFALRPRKVAKCTIFDNIEMRCSYIHSNMSLAMYSEKMGAYHGKLSGDDFNYNEIRYPWTWLTMQQLHYAVNDVRAVVECISIEMMHDCDNLYTIPLTSTGYVRRDVKRAIRNGHGYKMISECKPIDMELYTLLREAFRGGDTHANRFYAGKILEDVGSMDRSSSYPDVICNCVYPIRPLLPEPDCRQNNVLWLCSRMAVVFRLHMFNVKLTDHFDGCPYISRDKCRNILNGAFDNGRILAADSLVITVTDIDFRIILKHYTFEWLATDVYSSSYGKLPKPIIDCNIHYYKLKTELKGVAGEELYYLKSKNKLNSIYGLMAQNPLQITINFDGGEWNAGEIENPVKILKKAMLPYQWGVWTTAWARYRLHQAIDIAGNDFVYGDTDSVKYINSLDITDFNAQRIADSEKSGSYAKDKNGNIYHMGVFEQEKGYDKFCTLGAKKYAYIQKDKIGITIAGVEKEKGAKELKTLENFKPGYTFKEAGGVEAIYNDSSDFEVNIDGHRLHIGANVALVNSEYTLGITAEYERLLEYERQWGETGL